MHVRFPSSPLAVFVKLTLALPFAYSAYAADADTLVVTASGFAQQQEDAPASITVIQGDDLRKRSVQNLGDAVRDVEGVVVNGGTNESDISIRGMPGDYTLLMVDGKRQSGRDSRVNGNAGYEQSFMPPAAAIERIEVIRGPMSSLYGSDAIGGVINVITRKVSREWGGSVSYDYSARQHSDQGNASNTQFFLNGPLLEDKLGLQVWGRYLNRQADDNVQTTNGFTKADHRDLTARLAFTPTANHDILLEGGATRLKNGEGTSPNWATREQKNNRDHWSISHEGRWNWATSTLSLSQEKTSRQGVATARQADVLGRKPEIKNTVFDAKLVMPTDYHVTTAGAQWNQSTLKDWNQAVNDQKNYKFQVIQKALFAEDEWRLTEQFSLTTGLRLDHHEQYGNHINPRVYGVWHVNDEWTLKGGVARGFKAPELRAVIDDYAVLRRNTFVMFGNSDLKPETSTNYELSAMWSDRDTLSGGATIFYNDFKDKLSTRTTDQRWNNFIIMERINIDKAVIRGVELNGSWQIIPALSLKGNFTYTDSEQKSGANAGAPLALTPKHKANLRTEWNVSEQTQLWAAANYYGKEFGNTISAEPAPGYTTADIGVSHQLTPTVALNGAIYNVNDKRLDDETYGTVNYGRTFWFGTTITF
ncbi:ligand-gated channel protein [Pectobacterium betavasculorum]|uniref:Ligand-gated channel protein n=1 Tax=Pectobacterium betavasculorum TaxID=55207 RepID=A0A093RXR7_9GAMM|nr:TonB-dependent receptor [Pectobacterium betavasculorum]KFX05324.1 ligand-gated channel protein [Pectobacterium betavasculorum]KFX19608.1 ligand-gated channel protein [Pectobacterium betavasculorum]